jgi:hypothetical protein
LLLAPVPPELEVLASAPCPVLPCVEPSDEPHAIHDDEATAPSVQSAAHRASARSFAIPMVR